MQLFLSLSGWFAPQQHSQFFTQWHSDSVLTHIQCDHMGGSGVWCLVPKCATALKLSTAQTAVQQCFALMQWETHSVWCMNSCWVWDHWSLFILCSLFYCSDVTQLTLSNTTSSSFCPTFLSLHASSALLLCNTPRSSTVPYRGAPGVPWCFAVFLCVLVPVRCP